MDAIKPYIPVAIGLAALWAAYKYVPVGGAAGKAMILGAAGALIAKNIPVANAYIS